MGDKHTDDERHEERRRQVEREDGRRRRMVADILRKRKQRREGYRDGGEKSYCTCPIGIHSLPFSEGIKLVCSYCRHRVPSSS